MHHASPPPAPCAGAPQPAVPWPAYDAEADQNIQVSAIALSSSGRRRQHEYTHCGPPYPAAQLDLGNTLAKNGTVRPRRLWPPACARPRRHAQTPCLCRYGDVFSTAHSRYDTTKGKAHRDRTARARSRRPARTSRCAASTHPQQLHRSSVRISIQLVSCSKVR